MNARFLTMKTEKVIGNSSAPSVTKNVLDLRQTLARHEELDAAGNHALKARPEDSGFV